MFAQQYPGGQEDQHPYQQPSYGHHEQPHQEKQEAAQQEEPEEAGFIGMLKKFFRRGKSGSKDSEQRIDYRDCDLHLIRSGKW